MGPFLRSNYPYRRALATSYAVASGYPSVVPTTTAPVEAATTPAAVTGAFRLADGPAPVTQVSLEALFFGNGAENATFKAMLLGWKATKSGNIWLPVPIFEVTCTLSAMVGVAGTDVLDTDRIVDTITLTSGYDATAEYGTLLTSPAGDVAAHLVCSVQGFQWVQWIFNNNGSASGANALWTYF